MTPSVEDLRRHNSLEGYTAPRWEVTLREGRDAPTRTRLRRWEVNMRSPHCALVGCTALAVALFSVSGWQSIAAAPPEPVPFADAYYLGGRGKLAVKKLVSVRPNLSWQLELRDDGFTIRGASATPLTGTIERRGRTGKKVLLTFDEGSITALQAGLGDIVERHGLGSEFTFTIARVRASVVLGKTPEKTRLKVNLTLEGGTNGIARRGSFRFAGRHASRRVVVLDDGRSASQVLEALRRKRIAAFDVGFYQTWDGVNPPLDETDVVLFLQGYEYDDTMTETADQALVTFVREGGLLVRTEWGAYEWGDEEGAFAIDELLPVIAVDSDYESADDTVCSWAIEDRTHPLTAGLPTSFDIVGAGFSFVTPIVGATTLASNQRGEPTLAIADFDAGQVVHVNNDLTYAVDRISKHILRVLVNCAKYGLTR
jgi:hypothetical protein